MSSNGMVDASNGRCFGLFSDILLELVLVCLGSFLAVITVDSHRYKDNNEN